ncbi:MAG: 4Fe-4S dicluster domain-containing protein [Candidatus Aminicenantaceae bacterium]
MATLIQKYLFDDESFYAANFSDGQKVSFFRTLPYEETVNNKEYVEILDYEKATSGVKESNKFAIGLCSCRHEKLHIGEKKCNVPLETCSSFRGGADYSIRYGFAKEVSKSKMLENIARSKELGLVINVDNAQRNISFMCHCCKCCCNMLLGITKHGYPNTIVSSTYIAEVDESKCKSYDRCYEVCPIDCIERVPVENPTSKKETKPKIDESRCIGCGICAVKCPAGAIKMVKRKQRVIHPATIYERLMLQCLERGTLQYQLFDNPESITQKAMRALVGGFLRLPPVKKALMSDMLRSSFFRSLMRFKI